VIEKRIESNNNIIIIMYNFDRQFMITIGERDERDMGRRRFIFFMWTDEWMVVEVVVVANMLACFFCGSCGRRSTVVRIGGLIAHTLSVA